MFKRLVSEKFLKKSESEGLSNEKLNHEHSSARKIEDIDAEFCFNYNIADEVQINDCSVNDSSQISQHNPVIDKDEVNITLHPKTDNIDNTTSSPLKSSFSSFSASIYNSLTNKSRSSESSCGLIKDSGLIAIGKQIR